MRNLKKILALVLALVMSFSLMATANAFTDDEKITDTYETAVTVLSGLKVFQGYDDGSFLPQGSITRAEVAAIIYRIVTGDVEDKQVGIYADYNKFTDVPSTSWYAGYVNFCANAEYIKGRDAKTFDPNSYVTGYEALAMILRAIGYDKNGEFTGSNWQVQTAATGEQRGITKNITEGTLGAYASREVVAEILFQTILVDTVNYTPAFGYQLNDTSLGWDTFELEEISGVVVANEYADLYSASALKAGKTELDVDGDSYMLDYATTLEDLGEARDAYISFGDTVLYIADAGNTVFETGAETDIEKDKDFEDVTGMERDEDVTEQYINFGGDEDAYESDYRIEYVLEFVDADAKAAFAEDFNVTLGDELTFGEDFRVGETISANDLAIIKGIFYVADHDETGIEVGEVYVGTKSGKDISDEISYKTFYNEYIVDNTKYAEVDETVNGDWLKVIDNDGDGVADYVFKTVFVMAEVEKLSSKGTLTLSTPGLDSLDSDEYVTSAELEADDVVLYTYIDGMYYVELAPSFTGEVDKYTYKTETLTVEGEDYLASGIDEYTGYMTDLEDADKETEYTYYLDWFGFIRVYAEPADVVGELLLMTDGWYNETRTADEYAVKAWMDDEIQDLDVNEDETGGFIYDDYYTQNNSWGNLVTFGDYTDYTENAATNLGRYTESDGVLDLATALTYTYDKQGKISNIKTDYIDLDEVSFESGETDFPGYYAGSAYTTDDGNVTVQANNSTVFYYVVVNAKGEVTDVDTVVGYKNSIDVVDDIVGIRAMYAVATNTNADSGKDPYWVANAIVIETDAPVFNLSEDVVLGYNVLNKTVKDYADMEAINNTAALDELYVTSINGVRPGDTVDYDGVTYWTIPVPVFYFNTEDEEGESYINTIEKNFADYGIYVARVDRKVDLDDYIVALNSEKTHLWYTDETVVYDLEAEYNKSGALSAIVAETEDADGDALELETGSYYIIYANKSDIVYAVLVEDVDDVAFNLFGAIYADANPYEYEDIFLTVEFGDTTVAAGTTESLDYADAKDVKDWTVTTANGTKILSQTATPAVNVTAAGGTFILDVIAQSEDGKTTAAFKYTVTVNVAAADDGLYYNGNTTSENTISQWGGGATTIANMEKAYNSNVAWTHYDGLGNVIKDNTTSVTALKYSVAVVTAENRNTKTYYVYQGTAPTDADDIAADMVAGIDVTDADEVKAVVQYALDNSLDSNEFIKALDAADADKALIVETYMEVYNNTYENAVLSGNLVNSLAADLDDAKEVMDAYLGWLAGELEADDSTVDNDCGLTIEKTAGGWAIDFTDALVTLDGSGSSITDKNIDNSGLGGLSAALATKFGSGYTAEITWPGMTQDGSIDEFLGQWNAMQNAVLAGSSFNLTFTVTETADPSNTVDFNVTLG